MSRLVETTSRPAAATIAELRASGWKSRTVKAEIRANVVARLQHKEPVVEGVLGYEDSVFPAIETALLAGHDMVFLGERGQAKTRIIRSLVNLLDEWMPIVAGSEMNDDPYAPASKYARDLVAELGGQTKIDWVHRSLRYGEKLATPDTSIADLIGEVDPIKIAEGRYLSDELTIHYGLLPRSNRGIFAINELPDLAERIQVGLLNALEERDIQIRGHKVRLPIDVLLVASANPDDYTNRGRIITPLKDRFGAQIRTHYPQDVEIERAVILQEADKGDALGLPVMVPQFLTDVLAKFSQLARESTQINQRSGVSVRLSVTNYETLLAEAARRALRADEATAVARISDLAAIRASALGKIEVEAIDDGEAELIMERLLRAATFDVFKNVVDFTTLLAFVEAFSESGSRVSAGRNATTEELVSQLDSQSDFVAAVDALVKSDTELTRAMYNEDLAGAARASAFEFLLEGLHLAKRLNKTASTYSAK